MDLSPLLSELLGLPILRSVRVYALLPATGRLVCLDALGARLRRYPTGSGWRFCRRRRRDAPGVQPQARSLFAGARRRLRAPPQCARNVLQSAIRATFHAARAGLSFLKNFHRLRQPGPAGARRNVVVWLEFGRTPVSGAVPTRSPSDVPSSFRGGVGASHTAPRDRFRLENAFPSTTRCDAAHQSARIHQLSTATRVGLPVDGVTARL